MRISKGLLFIVVIFSTKIAFSQFKDASKSKSFFNDRPALINGKINNHISNTNNGFITFRTYALTGQVKDTSFYINDDGTFSGRLLQYFEGDIAVMYAGKYMSIYHIPGQYLYIQIDEVKWNDPENISASISLSGKAAQLGKMIVDFTKAFTKKEFMVVEWSDSAKSDEEVSLQRINRMQEEKSFLNSYLKSNNIRDEKFKRWAENYIIYNAGTDITFENFTNLRKKSLTIDRLMKVLKSIKIVNMKALYTSSYYAFLHQLQGAFQIIININPLYKESVKINGLNPIPVYTNYIDQHSHGLARQLMYFNLYGNISKSNYEYLFDSVIVDNLLKKQFAALKNKKAQSFTPFNVIDRLRSVKIDSSIKSRLISIFESKLDSYLFLDFWGTWCGPCMQEMPFYPQLISKFKNEKLKFLFFAASSEESDVLKVKDKFKIVADFLVLTDNEVKIMNNVLQFNSYPSHFFISPKGIVVENNVGRITSGGYLNQIVVDKINRLLVK